MKRTYTLLAIGCGLLFAASTCFAQMYTVTDLGTLGGTSGEAFDINNSGQVVGYAFTSGNAESHAFRTAANKPINPETDDLGTIGTPSLAYSINDSGQVAGYFFITPGETHAFRTAPNRPIDPATDDLGTLGGTSSIGRDINNHGQVVGFSYPPESKGWRGFRTASNRAINSATDDLGSFVGFFTIAEGVNDAGQAVGYSWTWDNGGTVHAFRAAPNRPINPRTDDLGTLGGDSSAAYAINSFGQVVGSSDLVGNISTHAFRAAPHRRINPATDDLGTLGGSRSSANGINSFGQVVGNSDLAGYLVHAFLYSGGRMRDLNELIPSDSGCEVFQASAINEAGQIAGNGVCSGENHPVVLNPIYQGLVRPPINADGSSVFSAKRESVSIAFLLNKYGTRTCTLPAATIAIVRVTDGRLTTARNAKLSITGCRYAYDLKANRLGVGEYRADISIDGIMVGHAVFALQ